MNSHWWVIPLLFAIAGFLMALERRGIVSTLFLSFKGDVKRETRFLAQYGQMVCTGLTAILVWQLDPNRDRKGLVVPTVVGVLLASVLAMLSKRLLGRVRPGRNHAGRFLGPSWKHDNARESFPSSHTACAVAMSAGLAWMYPQAAITFWGLALICGLLRYMADAHWASDVVGGLALGYSSACAAWWFFLLEFGKR